MKRKIFLPALALSLVTASGAIAQEKTTTDAAETTTMEKVRHGPAGKRLMRLDADKDGKVSAEEFSARRLDRLKAVDADGDGILSEDEMKEYVLNQFIERRVRRMTNRLDIDGDGEVTLAELEKYQAKRFALMDRNDDGTLDAGELRHGLQQGKGKRGGRSHMRGMQMRAMQMRDSGSAMETAPVMDSDDEEPGDEE